MARKKTNRIAKTMPGDVEIDKARKIVEKKHKNYKYNNIKNGL